MPIEPIELDDIDRRVLAAVQADNLVSAEQLGAAVGLSASAAQRRLRRLRDEGVIVADVSVVDPQAVGRAMTFIVELTLEREGAAELDAFKRRIQGVPEIQQCYYVTGDADFILVVVTRDMDEYDALTRRLFVENANVKRYRTSVAMSRVKVSLAVPTH
jgi:Lrp/AsnC family leucine-responsive transcriptional regulator